MNELLNTDKINQLANNQAVTKITEYSKEGYEGMKFAFVCDGNYETVAETAKEAIEWFVSFTGKQPKTVIQVSKYPTIS